MRRVLAKLLLVIFVIVLANNFLVSTVYKTADTLQPRSTTQNLIVFFGTTPKINGLNNLFYQHRLAEVVKLAHSQTNSQILVTGFHTDNYSEVTAMLSDLKQSGVNPARILVDNAQDTFDSMQHIKKLKGYENIILVSQKFHLERAYYIALFLGLNPSIQEAKTVSFGSSPKTYLREFLARIKIYFDLIYS